MKLRAASGFGFDGMIPRERTENGAIIEGYIKGKEGIERPFTFTLVCFITPQGWFVHSAYIDVNCQSFL